MIDFPLMVAKGKQTDGKGWIRVVFVGEFRNGSNSCVLNKKRLQIELALIPKLM